VVDCGSGGGFDRAFAVEDGDEEAADETEDEYVRFMMGL
jgi:hypothetical protein